MTAERPTFPCCEHCEPEVDGRCWAHEIGHGCSCLKCPPPTPHQFWIHEPKPLRPITQEQP